MPKRTPISALRFVNVDNLVRPQAARKHPETLHFTHPLGSGTKTGHVKTLDAIELYGGILYRSKDRAVVGVVSIRKHDLAAPLQATAGFG